MITTARLDLVPATIDLTRAALDDAPGLGVALNATVPPTWPPELLDRPALEFTLDVLRRHPDQAGWWLYFVVLRASAGTRTLIGSVGYKGPPREDGTVEVGYGIVEDHRRHGYASEATRALISRAFSYPPTRRVTAETFPELTASIGVMRSCGLSFIGDGSEPGVICYELTRQAYIGR